MHLVQSTGFLVDFYFFAPVSNLTIDAMRDRFLQQIQQRPSRVFVITKQVFPESTTHPDSWSKLENLAASSDFLNDRYTRP
jgi:hypothetical protein